jgi:hypothetical protein
VEFEENDAKTQRKKSLAHFQNLFATKILSNSTENVYC